MALCDVTMCPYSSLWNGFSKKKKKKDTEGLLLFQSDIFLSFSIPFLVLTLQHQPPSPDEDFLIEVSPGTYTVTASLQESQQRQTQLVSVRPGESVVLTFTL